MGIYVNVLGKPVYNKTEVDTRPESERIKPISETYAVVVTKSAESQNDYHMTRLELAQFDDLELARRCAANIRVALAMGSIR